MKEGQQVRPEWVPNAYSDKKIVKDMVGKIDTIPRGIVACDLSKRTIKKTYKKSIGR